MGGLLYIRGTVLLKQKTAVYFAADEIPTYKRKFYVTVTLCMGVEE